MDKKEYMAAKENYWKNNDWFGFVKFLQAENGIAEQWLANVDVLRDLGYAYNNYSKKLATGSLKDEAVLKNFNEHIKYLLLSQQAYEAAIKLVQYDNMLYVSFAYFYYSISENANIMNNYRRKAEAYVDRNLYREYEAKVKNISYREAKRLYEVIFAHQDDTVKNHYRYAKLLNTFADQYDYKKSKANVDGKADNLLNDEKNKAYKESFEHLLIAEEYYNMQTNEKIKQREYKEYCRSLYNIAKFHGDVINRSMDLQSYFSCLQDSNKSIIFYKTCNRQFSFKRDNAVRWSLNNAKQAIEYMEKLLALPEYKLLKEVAPNIRPIAIMENTALNSYDMAYRLGKIYEIMFLLSFEADYIRRFLARNSEEELSKKRDELFRMAEKYYMATMDIKLERRRLKKNTGGFNYEILGLCNLYLEYDDYLKLNNLIDKCKWFFERDKSARLYYGAVTLIVRKDGSEFPKAKKYLQELRQQRNFIQYQKKVTILENYMQYGAFCIKKPE